MHEEISFKILENLTEDKRRIILVNLKTEIEYYYQQNYLIKDAYFLKNNYGDLINSGTIPRAYWENTRIKYINSFSKVVVPSYCNVCNSHRAFVVDLVDYLKSVIRTYSPYPNKRATITSPIDRTFCINSHNFNGTKHSYEIKIPFNGINGKVTILNNPTMINTMRNL